MHKCQAKLQAIAIIYKSNIAFVSYLCIALYDVREPIQDIRDRTKDYSKLVSTRYLKDRVIAGLIFVEIL